MFMNVVVRATSKPARRRNQVRVRGARPGGSNAPTARNNHDRRCVPLGVIAAALLAIGLVERGAMVSGQAGRMTVDELEALPT